MSETSEIPHRRLKLHLELEADDLNALCQSLQNIATDLHIEGREVRQTTSGGVRSGFNLWLTCDEEQTAERFAEQLMAYVSAKKERDDD
jgi:hypothetical protein